MAQHRTLMAESIATILHRTVTLDGIKYMVTDVNHVSNGVYSLCLKPKKGSCTWVEVLTENGKIIFIDS